MAKDKEYERLRQKRLAELQGEVGETVGVEEPSDAEQVERQRQLILRQLLTSEALSRVETVKLGHPDLAKKVEDYLILLLKAGRLEHKITEEELKLLLIRLNPKREIKIRRK
jgi:DNA-binding TFAR19-related protein (PDSD5 family)